MILSLLFGFPQKKCNASYFFAHTNKHSNVQQLGRTHRSNQISAPEFKLLITDVGSELRLVSSVANRLEALGALTSGDRKACSGSSCFQEFSIQTKYANKALKNLAQMIKGDLQPPEDKKQVLGSEAMKKALCDVQLTNLLKSCGSAEGEKNTQTDNVKRFLNRLMGMPIALQSHVFEVWMELLDRAVNEARRSGKFSEGIVELAEGNVEVIQETVLNDARGVVKCVRLKADRGISWEQAQSKWSDCQDQGNIGLSGFYYSKQTDDECFLAVAKRTAVSEGRIK
jgi:hypothetical protein